MSVLGDSLVPSSFRLCSKARTSHPACRASASGLGLDLSTAVLQVLTRSKHTVRCLHLQHAIGLPHIAYVFGYLSGVGGQPWRSWCFSCPHRTVGCTQLWYPTFDFSLLASCATHSTHLCLFTLEKENQLRNTKLFSLAWSINQTKQREMKWKWSVTSGEKPSFDLSWYCWLQLKGKTFHNSFITLWHVK